MKLQIGEKLKLLRREKGVTQEKLAEVLGVSCQSVSRWELGVCYPDLELLPALANYFGVTLDALVGMEEIRSAEKRNAVFTAALDRERLGDWDGAIAVLREGLRTYPNDDGLLAELALALSGTERKREKLEAVELSERVLAQSTNEKVRSTTRANLCFLYRELGQAEKAFALGKTLPHIWECREVLLPDLAEDREEQVDRGLNVAAQVLRDMVQGEKIAFSLGYRAEEGVDTQGLREWLK